MDFLDLPPEIIDVILDLSCPLGIEGLVLTCKALYGRAKSQIERHNTLRRRWKHTTNFETGRLDDTLGILYEIALDPLAAEYIETLDLWDERGIEAEDVDLLDFRDDHTAMEKVNDLVTTLPFLKSVGIDAEKWWRKIVQEEDERVEEDSIGVSYTTVTLLALLPNLKFLRLDPGWKNITPELGPGDETLLAGLNAISLSARDANHTSERPLSKLKTFLPFMNKGYEEKTALQTVQPFLELESLEEIYLVSAVAVEDGYTGFPFKWQPYNDITLSLTRVELSSCCMDADGIAALVSHTPSLSIFRYSHEMKWEGCQYDWNAGLFVEALARYCGSTIIEMAITIDDLLGEIVNGASSFLSFPRLELLELDVRVFCGPPVESGQQLGQNSFIPEGQQPWSYSDIPCVGSMVPKSIKECMINTDFPEPDETALNRLLKNLRTQRLERLHNLERVIVRQYTGESARVFVERAGATLETFDPHVENPRARSRMPLWKRNFEERIAMLLT